MRGLKQVKCLHGSAQLYGHLKSFSPLGGHYPFDPLILREDPV